MGSAGRAIRAPELEEGPPDAVVRRLEADDWRDLREIRLRALADAPDAFGSTLAREKDRDEADWRGWLEAQDRVVVVAERGGRIVGIASGGPAPSEERIAGLYAMWVEPASRGSGVAARLVTAVEEWAQDAGYPRIGLGVTTTNERAVAFYRKLGYDDSGERHPLREGSGLSIAIMVKSLDAG